VLRTMSSTKVGYRAGWLIDGTGKPAVKNQVVVINDGRIQHIYSGDDPETKRIDVVDMADCTMFPALIDSHVHLVMSGTTEASLRKHQLVSNYEERRDIIAGHLKQYLACGVLAVRDGGDHGGDTLRYKLKKQQNQQSAVTIAAAGRARHAVGRYGKLIGIPVADPGHLTRSAFGAQTRRDHLKLVNSGLNSLTQFGVESPPQFSAKALHRVIGAARAHGQPTMVHANGHQPVKLAVNAGCSSIEHGFFMGAENMRRMADKGVFWVPTAVTMKAYSDYLKNQGHRCDPSFGEVSRKNLLHQLEQMSAAREMGVILALGTDAGSPGVHHGLAVKEELQLFISAGYSVEGAIRCASRNGALLMGLNDRGKIAPGMRADMVAVIARPQDVPDKLHDISFCMLNGCSVDDSTQS